MDYLYGFAFMVVLGTLGLYFRNKRMKGILRQRGYDDDNCSNCGCTEVNKLSSNDVYVCPRCGHEGGSGRRGFERR